MKTARLDVWNNLNLPSSNLESSNPQLGEIVAEIITRGQ